MNQMRFICYAKPQPQGSVKGFVVNGRAILTSANKNLKPYRQELTHVAWAVLKENDIQAPVAGKHVPVELVLDFYLERPASISKKRKEMVVKPDIDKLARSTIDSLTGIIYHDDAQIVGLSLRKYYGVPERVEVSVQIVDESREVKAPSLLDLGLAAGQLPF